MKKLGVTQELLSLVTGLAHYLKLLIRISLQGALKLERETGTPEGLHRFLDELSDLEALKDADKSLESAGVSGLADRTSDLCYSCRLAIEDECARLGDKRWHIACLVCSKCRRELGSKKFEKKFTEARFDEANDAVLCIDDAKDNPTPCVGGFEHSTKLQQYIFLLRVALARLLSMLRTNGALPQTPGT
jgi:LIM domain